uniref:HlyB/MsbA family ABC transporter n=1 Tax=Thermosporothrix sp. COM3 TaxID=2490863 RepID=A0A455SE03_9CHLR|nr:HlyB/MsbA family ABC transporter [Thermosporothrix sp. COM3]
MKNGLFKIIMYAPQLYLLNALLQIFRSIFLLLPGPIIAAFFDSISHRHQSGWNLWTLGALLVGAGIARVLAMLSSVATDTTCVETGKALLRRNVFQQIIMKTGARTLPASSGDMLNRFREDAHQVSEPIVYNLMAFGAGVQALIAIITLLSINPLITIVALIPMIGSNILMERMTTRIRAYHRESRQAAGAVSSFLGEVLKNTQAIQLTGTQQYVIAHLRHLNEKRRQTTLKSLFFTNVVLVSVSRNTTNIAFGIILLLAAQAMQQGSFTVGELAFFILYLDQITAFIAQFSIGLAKRKQAGVSLQRLQAILPADVPENAVVDQSPLHLRGTYPALPQPQRQAEPLTRLEARNLTYLHPQSKKGIEDISFLLLRGTCTVVTGRIGSGKSTLLRSLLGLLPASGAIYWNGQQITNPASFFVPPQSAYTPQVPRLCSETLRQNILMGLPDEPERLHAAIHAAVMERDIQMLEKGLETVVGPKGTKLSGGQIQRTAAARMFLREPDLLVFDDLSSALDVETERQLWERLFTNRAHTCLLVSHRRFALQQADQILVLQDGRLVAAGPLEQLLETSEAMRSLWNGTIES